MLFTIDFLFFSSSRSFLNIFCIFSIHASFLFLRLGSSLFSLLGILFQACCLFPLHSLGLVGFSFAPSFATYFTVISFCPTYCLRGLVSTGCRVVVHLASGVCPLVGAVGPVACLGFMLGRTGACSLAVGAESCPSECQGCIRTCVLGYL